MKNDIPLIAMLVAALLCGCTVSQTAAPELKRQAVSEVPSVGLVGFTSETVDVNPYFGGTAHSFSGTAYGRGGSVNYYGTGSSSFSGVSFSRRETSAMLGETANALADLGVPLPQDPDYIVSGTYHGPRTDWTLWYKDAAVDIFSLTLLWNVRQMTVLDLRIFDAKTGKMEGKITAIDGYRFTSFGFLPLYGHFFHPLMWPNNLYSHCTKRVTVKAVNELVGWLESRPHKEGSP
ncbi:MAG: hypothetical protein EOM72_10750 [Opitutae bacterium]|nr:hypothetical protein [Opitutae bacterium]